MQGEVQFSIVVPVYNRAELIERTLRSLQRQEFDDYEIVVVDDGSTDRTAEVVQGLLDARTRYVRTHNGERAAARNHGASIARGQYVNFFDSDDLARPNHLAVAAQLVEKRGEVEWFHLGFAMDDERGDGAVPAPSYSSPTLNRMLAAGNVLSCNGVFVRRDVAARHPFNEDRALSASEDYELWCRLAARYPLYYLNEPTSIVVDHQARSVRTTSPKKLVQRLQLLVEYLERDEEVVRFFGRDFRKIRMEAHSYVALHLAEFRGQKISSFKFLSKAVRSSPTLLGKRRFFATVKRILTQW